MAIRIDIERSYIKRALEQAIASLKRAENKDINPMMKEIIQKDITMYQNAINTMTDIK